ncbi:MAG: hypothetical protein WCI92_04370 [Bacteroidota bacterium]
MKTLRFISAFTILAYCFTVMLYSCKQKNEEYPPRIWSEYAYTSSTIAYRDISALFIENEHSTWLGSKGNEGLLYNDGYKWTVFEKSNTGINFDSITAITRDGNGILWVSWNGGLATFDGNQWNENSLFKGLCVTSIAVAGIGNIIAGINGEKGGIAELQNNEWTFYTLSNSEIPSGKINSLASDHKQALWLATADNGIVKFDNNKWDIISDSIPLLSSDFTKIMTATDGSIWAGSVASQLTQFYNNTSTLFYTGVSKPITSLVEAGEGSMWCSTFGAGIIKFDGINWTSFTKDNAALPTNDIITMVKNSTGIMFFSIPGGKVLMLKP